MEFPHTHLPANADDAIFEALNHGLVPIITHPERNPSIAQNPKLIFSMVESGALVQLTAASLTGGFGPAAKACSRYLLKKKMVHFLASDGHSAQNRPPVFSAGLKLLRRLSVRKRRESWCLIILERLCWGMIFDSNFTSKSFNWTLISMMNAD